MDDTSRQRSGRSAAGDDPPGNQGSEQRTRTFDSAEYWPKVGHYQISGEIGRGGMGVVYRALDQVLGREVALKTVIPGSELNRNRKQRILREARAASKLSHPGIVPVFEVFEADGVPWISMQLVEGRSLERQLTKAGPGPIDTTLEQQSTLAAALAAAHVRGVLHRDIKPSNILIADDGTVRLSDFGLARSMQTDGESLESDVEQLTRPGGMVGTLPYMSPEQVLGRKLDGRSDIFSLGAVFHEMITGTRAFTGSNNSTVINDILNEQPPAMAHPTEPVPDALQLIVDRCLAKQPRDRYQSADELARDLTALVRVSGSSSSRSLRRIAPGKRRSWAITVAVIGVAAFMAATMTWWARQSGTRLPQFVARQLTDEPNLEADPEVSPNGQEIAYTLTEKGNKDIWITDTRGGTPLRLTTDPADDYGPTWYPDGSAILFVSTRGGEDGLWRVSHFGGTPELVVPDAVDPAVSPDGRTIAFARRDADGITRIGVAPLDDLAAARLITESDGGFWEHREPSWSPDGKTIAFRDFRNLWLVPSQGGPKRNLTLDDPPDYEPAWSPDGRWIYFSSVREGARAIWRIPSGGGDLLRVTTGTGSEHSPSVSADGRRMVYATFHEDTFMEIVDRSTGERSRLHDARHVSQPTISPDGRSVVFVSSRENSVDLWRIELEHEKPMASSMRLTRHEGSCSNPRFSKDGRWIAYYRVLEGRRDLWVIDSHGGTPHQITDHASTDILPDWSPDGGRIAFSSERSGSMQLWIVDVADGQAVADPRRITDVEGTALRPIWSPGGDELAFGLITESGHDVWVVTAAGGSEPRRLTMGAEAPFTQWTSDNELLVAGYWGGHRLEIRSLSPSTGADSPVTELVLEDVNHEIWSFDVTHDGRSAVLSVFDHRGDVWELEAESGTF